MAPGGDMLPCGNKGVRPGRCGYSRIPRQLQGVRRSHWRSEWLMMSALFAQHVFTRHVVTANSMTDDTQQTCHID
jgi:hypothetical protein